VDRKMKELGGTRAKPVALADEGTGLEDVVEPWLETVMMDLQKAFDANNAADAPKVKPTDRQQKDVEEKKDEETHHKSTPNAESKTKTEPNSEQTQPGLLALRSIAKLHNITIPQQRLPNTTLPCLTTSMSSCVLIENYQQDNQEHNPDVSTTEDEIISSSSMSNACHYTIRNPFSSSILNARYLTNTDIRPVEKALSNLTSSNSNTASKITKIHNAIQQLEQGFDIQENSKHAKRVIQITLSLPEDYSLEYEPGDSIGLLVTNEYTTSFQTIVSTLEKQQQHSINKTNLQEQMVSVNGEPPISVYQAIANCVDITSIVRKRILARLSQLCSDEHESLALMFMSSKSSHGECLYNELISKYALNLGHVLQLFPSCQPTIQDLLAICDGLVPRYYSISSSPLKFTDQLTVAFSVVDHAIMMKNEDGTIPPYLSNIISNRRHGLATQYLELHCAPFLCGSSNHVNDKYVLANSIKLFPKPTTDFRLPKSISTPLILIGPGTGVAPFFGFLSHCECLRIQGKQMEAQAEQGTWRGGFEIEDEDTNIPLPPNRTKVVAEDYAKTRLFFCCRWPNHDYLFQKELEQFVANGTLTSLHTAFSRMNEKKNDANTAETKTNSNSELANHDETVKKEQGKYVQDEMRLVGEELVQMICNDNASVYVCGDGNAMGKDVQECLAALLEKYGNAYSTFSEGETNTGTLYVEKMKKQHKFILDIWS